MIETRCLKNVVTFIQTIRTEKRTIVTLNILRHKIKALILIICFNYFIAQKPLTQIFQDKYLLLFHGILASCAKSNTCVAVGMGQIVQEDMNSHFVSDFIF